MKILERLGLHRPELRAWAMYDWANSAFVLVVITAVFPIYYETVVTGSVGIDGPTATKWLSYTTTASLALVALASPILGAVADFLAIRKRLLGVFVGLGSAATIGLVAVEAGDWPLALLLFGIGNLSIFLSFVFYDSLLPHLARSDDELDRVSTGGYAIGYLGSGLLLVALLALIQSPQTFGFGDDAGTLPTRLGFLAVGLWWAAFSLPLFLRVPEPPREIEADETQASTGIGDAVGVAFTRLRETLGELRGDYRQAFRMLIAFMIYNEGIGTIIRMGAIYAATKEFPSTSIIVVILLIQFVGIPFAFLFGWLGPKIGTKNAILVGLGVYVLISIVGYLMDTLTQFYLMGALIAMVQGGTQGLSRSLFGSMVPKHKASEFFGFFSIFAKVAGIFGPLVFGLVIEATGSVQQAVLSVIVFFFVGAALLTRVDVEEGQRRAREADASASAV